VSLDGTTKETFEAIRRRSTFEVVWTNLHRFHAYTRRRGTSFHIAFCLMRQNWHEFQNILQLADRLDCDVVVNTVIDPSSCSLFTLPAHELRGVLSQLEKQGAQAGTELRRNRGVWDAWIERLGAALRRDQPQSAETVVSATQALVDNPLARAGRMIEQREYEAALSEAATIGARHPDRYFALTVSAQVLGLQRRWDEARQALEEALRITQKLPDAFLNLARVDFQQGRTDEAIENARHALMLVVPEEPADAQVHALLAWLYVRQRRLLRAYRAAAHWAALPHIARHARIDADAAIEVCTASARRGLDETLLGALQVIAQSVLAISRAIARVVGPAWSSPRLHVLHGAAGGAGAAPSGHVSPRRDAEQRSRISPTLRVAGVCRAYLVPSPSDSRKVRVVVEQGKSAAAHDIQLNYAGFSLTAQRRCVIRLRVRADAHRMIGWGVSMAGEPWSNLGLYRTLEVGPEWQELEESFTCETAVPQARVHLDLAGSDISLELSSLLVTEPERE
jgi:tetratricopeptide (TPR) repeat protein